MIGSIRLLAAAAVLTLGTFDAPLPQIGAAPATAQNGGGCYRTFWPGGRELELDACEHPGGGSGFIAMRNVSRRDIHVCYTLHFGDGTQSRGCNFRVRAGTEGKSSCAQCSRKRTGGLVKVTWRTVKPAT
jgi:hypothetical protein